MADSPQFQPQSDADSQRSMWRATGMGVELAGAIGGMALLGWFIDRWQGTAPMWLMILMGVGVIGGGYNFIRQALAMNRKASAAYRQTRSLRGPAPKGSPNAGRADAGMFHREQVPDDDEDEDDWDKRWKEKWDDDDP